MIYYRYGELGNIIGLNYLNNDYYYIKNIQNDVIGIMDNQLNIIVKYKNAFVYETGHHWQHNRSGDFDISNCGNSKIEDNIHIPFVSFNSDGSITVFLGFEGSFHPLIEGHRKIGFEWDFGS